MAIVLSVLQWCNYLLGWRFRICTDHKSLKYLLQQRISTMDQQRWLVKLMGYDYEIEYKPGRENVAVDTLSRVHGELTAITYPRPTWLAIVPYESHNDPLLIAMREDLQKGTKSISGYEARGGQLWYKGKLVLSPNSLHKEAIIREFHDTPVGGHSGIFQTFKCLVANFHWMGMKRDVQHYIQRCDVCQRNKHDTMTLTSLLQLLPISDWVWEDVSMDFIEGFPTSSGFFVILVVVDRLSKYGHFIALKHPYLAKMVVETFVKEVMWLHGMPRSIVFDRDPIFTSRFWSEFFRLQGSELRMSSTYHPQTDGQMEVLNCCLETYLCCFASSKQK